MSAPEGNKYYMLRTKDGRLKDFPTPEKFFNACMEYFKWCEANPWIMKDFVKSGMAAGDIVSIPTARPYTIEGLCNHLRVTVQTFHNYGKNEKYQEYFEVVQHVRQIIKQNQLEGASVGAYNSSIIARLLGLADKVDHRVSDMRKTVDEVFPTEEDLNEQTNKP